MLLNARTNNFYFVFPKGFFPSDIHEKYIDYIKRQPSPFDTLTSFMNSSIQTVSFPAMSMGSSEQVKNLGKRINFQSAVPVQDLFNRDFTVSFRIGEGFINYFIMLETILTKLNFKNPNLYIQNLPLRIMDNNGNILVSATFKEVTLTSLSSVDFNYTQNNPQVYTFSVGFAFNFIDINLEIARDN